MMWHLVRAQLWRVRWLLPQLLLTGGMSAASEGVSHRFMSGLALGSAGSLLLTLGLFWSRELRVLPLVAETALRSAWYTVMIFPAVIMAARLLVVLGGPLVGLAPSMTMEGLSLIHI